jgi:hypothetical protein
MGRAERKFRAHRRSPAFKERQRIESVGRTLSYSWAKWRAAATMVDHYAQDELAVRILWPIAGE